jgi:hypothetical protein
MDWMGVGNVLFMRVMREERFVVWSVTTSNEYSMEFFRIFLRNNSVYSACLPGCRLWSVRSLG